MVVRINFDQPITDLDGRPLHESGIARETLKAIATRLNDELGIEAAANTVRIIRDVVGAEPITLRRLAVDVLLVPPEGNKLDLAEKIERSKLAERIHQSGEGGVEIDLSMAGKLREWLGERHGPLLAYRVDQLLDPEARETVAE